MRASFEGFGAFETAVTTVSVIIVQAVQAQGEATYLSGVILVVAYAIIAISFLFIEEP